MRPLWSLRPDITLRSLIALRTLQPDISLWSLRPDVALGTLFALGTDVALRALRSLRPDITLRPDFALRPLVTLRTLIALRTFRPDVTCRSLGANVPSLTRRSRLSGISLPSHRPRWTGRAGRSRRAWRAGWTLGENTIRIPREQDVTGVETTVR